MEIQVAVVVVHFDSENDESDLNVHNNLINTIRKETFTKVINKGEKSCALSLM